MNELITPIEANFDESKQSQLPLVELLINLGYTYITCEEALSQRGSDTSRFILRDIARQKLMEINSYEYNGKVHQFREADIAQVIEELEATKLEGLIHTSQEIFHTIMPTSGGKTIQVMQGGRPVSKDIRFFDFEHPKNNAWHVAVEYPASAKGDIRPDVVIFVNGIPIAVIECKRSSKDVELAIAQQLRNQLPEKCPQFFVYPQILAATNGKDFRYGTTGTPEKFYVRWREKGIAEEELAEAVQELINIPIDKQVYQIILKDLNGWTAGHDQVTDRTVTEQDKSVWAMFRPERLLDLAKNHILYDAGVKKISRYTQYFAVKKIMDRIQEWEESPDGHKKRKGGLVWHTQGSGKSLTMVLFVKLLIESPDIKNPRVIVVTDRRDLDRQIRDTFRNCGLKKKVTQAKKSEHLLKLIQDKSLDVVTTLVQKFEAASNKRADFVDEDENIFVLVDEAHRHQSGEANIQMTNTMPHACYIAFTGTPLMKKGRESYRKFGDYIDKYTIDQALEDKVVLPLIYEGRYIVREVNEKQVDKGFDRVSDGLSDEQKKKLGGYAESRVIRDNPQGIREVARDIEKHYTKHFQGTGLKAQIVAPSKYAAVLFQHEFEKSGKIDTTVVISDDDGIIEEDDSRKAEVAAYLKKVKESYNSSIQKYEQDVIASFKNNPDGIEIIIVVDKLLTGFDAPRNTVLYLVRDIKDHNLLQAIARVNRLFDNDSLEKSSGYIVDYSENAKNLKNAMQLFSNFDEQDVAGTLVDLDDKIAELQNEYARVHDFFRGIENTRDDEAYIQKLKDEVDRKSFYEAVNEFTRTFKEGMALRDFGQAFPDIDLYRCELKKFTEIKRSVALRYADDIDLKKYRRALIEILDQYVDADGIEVLTEPIDVMDAAGFNKAVEVFDSESSRAEAIAAQTKRTITEYYEKDPEFYGKFSEKVRQIIEDMHLGRLADIEALKELQSIQKQVAQREAGEISQVLESDPVAGLLYRNFSSDVFSLGLDNEEEVSKKLSEIVSDAAIVDWYRNIEIKRKITNLVDDYLYDKLKERGLTKIDNEKVRALAEKIVRLAELNHEMIT